MTAIVVAPLSRIAEMAVRHGASEMISLLAANQQNFHRPAVIASERHLKLGLNDITFAGTGDLVAPSETHVDALIAFARTWDRTAPLIVHCWMGVSRSPAAALIASLATAPDEDDMALALRLRAVAPHATPNIRLVEIGDALLQRNGRLTAAVKAIGRGTETDGTATFLLPLYQPIGRAWA